MILRKLSIKSKYINQISKSFVISSLRSVIKHGMIVNRREELVAIISILGIEAIDMLFYVSLSLCVLSDEF